MRSILALLVALAFSALAHNANAQGTTTSPPSGPWNQQTTVTPGQQVCTTEQINGQTVTVCQ
jgi:hypothetical protein